MSSHPSRNPQDSPRILRPNEQPDAPDFSIRRAETEQDKKDIVYLRELVYVKEQDRLERAADLEDNIFGRFEQFSTYFNAYVAGRPVATIRLISDSHLGLPCERGANLQALRPDNRLVEFGHFISAPEFRSRGIGFQLWREAWGYSVVRLQATHALVDIFADDASSLGPKYFLARGFRQLGDIYCDSRFKGNPRSMVVMLDVKEGMKLRERAQAVEYFVRKYPQVDAAAAVLPGA